MPSMPHDIVLDTIMIHAPIERLFALSTRVELVQRTLDMDLVEGPVHVQGGDRVHWYGWKFGLPTHHHTLITGYAAPHTDAQGNTTAWFQDSQEKGRFAFFQHDHYFRESIDPATGAPQTHLEDVVRFALPFGWPGRIAAKLLLGPHIRRLVRVRYGILRELAEGDGWRQWVDAATLSRISSREVL